MKKIWVLPMYAEHLTQLNVIIHIFPQLQETTQDFTIFFIFAKNLPLVENIKIGHIYLSDHAPLQMTINNDERPSSIWRFNNPLLHFVNEIYEMESMTMKIRNQLNVFGKRWKKLEKFKMPSTSNDTL